MRPCSEQNVVEGARVMTFICTMRHPKANDTRTSLLGRMKNLNDHESWQTFHATYAKLIHSQARRAGLDENEAQDVVQETLIEFCHRFQSFSYDRRTGSFKAWLFQLARWRIANQFQKRSHVVVSLETMLSDEEDTQESYRQVPALRVEPDQVWEQEWQTAVFETALSTLKRKWPAKHYQAIDCLLVKQWNVTRVCQVLGMNRAHIYVLRFRAIRQLAKEVARLKQ
jgi:RNA polymerase sigma factor (sigma-70 family)